MTETLTRLDGWDALREAVAEGCGVMLQAKAVRQLVADMDALAAELADWRGLSEAMLDHVKGVQAAQEQWAKDCPQDARAECEASAGTARSLAADLDALLQRRARIAARVAFGRAMMSRGAAVEPHPAPADAPSCPGAGSGRQEGTSPVQGSGEAATAVSGAPRGEFGQGAE